MLDSIFSVPHAVFKHAFNGHVTVIAELVVYISQKWDRSELLPRLWYIQDF